MSNIQASRERIREWLSETVRIDEFNADPPEQLFTLVPVAGSSTEKRPVPANTCIEYPVKELSYEQHSLQGLTGRGLFTYSIVHRYSQDLTLDQLPIDKHEGLSQYLTGQAILGLGGCGGIKQVEAEEQEFPVQVSRDETSQNDWLIYVHLSVYCTFALTEFDLDPDFQIAPPPVADEFNNLNVRIYRASLGLDPLSDSVLDAEFDLRAPDTE